MHTLYFLTTILFFTGIHPSNNEITSAPPHAEWNYRPGNLACRICSRCRRCHRNSEVLTLPTEAHQITGRNNPNNALGRSNLFLAQRLMLQTLELQPRRPATLSMSILTSGLIGLGLVGEAVISPAGISYDFMRPALQMTAILFGIYLYLHAKVPPLLVFDQFLMNGFHRIFHSITRISTSTI